MVIETRAVESVEVLTSVTVTPGEIFTGVPVVLSPAVNAADPVSVVSTGG